MAIRVFRRCWAIALRSALTMLFGALLVSLGFQWRRIERKWVTM